MSLRSASDLTLLSNANQRESMSKVGTSRRKLMFQRSMWVTHFNVQQQMCTMDNTVYDTLVCFKVQVKKRMSQTMPNRDDSPNTQEYDQCPIQCQMYN